MGISDHLTVLLVPASVREQQAAAEGPQEALPALPAVSSLHKGASSRMLLPLETPSTCRTTQTQWWDLFHSQMTSTASAWGHKQGWYHQPPTRSYTCCSGSRCQVVLTPAPRADFILGCVLKTSTRWLKDALWTFLKPPSANPPASKVPPWFLFQPNPLWEK